MLAFTSVRIVGPSMEPGFRNGDWWLVRRLTSFQPGQVVLMTHPERPHALIVKRLARRDPDGWWVLGDNRTMSEDSRAFGHVPPESLIGKLVWRYWRQRL